MLINNNSRHFGNNLSALKKSSVSKGNSRGAGAVAASRFAISPSSPERNTHKNALQAQTKTCDAEKPAPRNGSELFELIVAAYHKHKESGESEMFSLEQFDLTCAEYFSFESENGRRIAAGGGGVFVYTRPLSFPYYSNSPSVFSVTTSAEIYLIKLSLGCGKYSSGEIPHEMTNDYLCDLNEAAKGSPNYPDNFYATLELYNRIDWSKYAYATDEYGAIGLQEGFGDISNALKAFIESYANSSWQQYVNLYEELLATVESATETKTAREMLGRLLGSSPQDEQNAIFDEPTTPQDRPIPLDSLAAQINAFL